MMKVIDYIFYRIFYAYKKAKDDPTFNAIWIFSSILTLYVCVPLLVFSDRFFNFSKLVWLAIFLILYALAAIIIARRYNKKKITEIQIEYRFSKYNKWIRNWMIYLGLIVSIPLGLFTIPLWGILFKILFSF